MVIDISLWIVLIPFVIVVYAFAYLLGKATRPERKLTRNEMYEELAFNCEKCHRCRVSCKCDNAD